MDAAALTTAALTLLQITKSMIEKGGNTHECFVLASRAAEMIFLVADKEDEKPKNTYTYKVFLVSHGNKRIHCIKAVREFIDLGLKEAKDLVESAPCALLQTTDFEQAWALYSKLLTPPPWKDPDAPNEFVVCELGREKTVGDYKAEVSWGDKWQWEWADAT